MPFFLLGPKTFVTCLTDIPGLDQLRHIARLHNVEITAHGSLVRQLVSLAASDNRIGPIPPSGYANAHIVGTAKNDPDFFSLTEFVQDIDLVHSGASELTRQIIKGIYKLVPGAEAFRWEVRSREADAEFADTRRCNGIVPAALLTLSTTSGTGVVDEWNGVGDILDGRIRFIRNGSYRQGPRYKNGLDVEFFAVLLFARVVVEAELWGGQISAWPQAEDEARSVVTDALNDADVYRRLQASDYLRARLRYLLHATFRCSPSVQRAIETLSRLGFDELFEHLIDKVPSLAPTLEPFVVGARYLMPQSAPAILSSAWLGGDEFRLPPRATFTLVPQQPAGGAAEDAFAGFTFGDYVLAPGHSLLAYSDQFDLPGGASSSSGVPVGETIVSNEFVDVCLYLVGDQGLCFLKKSDEDLTAILELCGNGVARYFPVPARCYVVADPVDQNATMVCASINCLGLFEVAARLVNPVNYTGKVQARLLLIAWDASTLALTEEQQP